MLRDLKPYMLYSGVYSQEDGRNPQLVDYTLKGTINVSIVATKQDNNQGIFNGITSKWRCFIPKHVELLPSDFIEVGGVKLMVTNIATYKTHKVCELVDYITQLNVHHYLYDTVTCKIEGDHDAYGDYTHVVKPVKCRFIQSSQVVYGDNGTEYVALSQIETLEPITTNTIVNDRALIKVEYHTTIKGEPLGYRGWLV